MPYQVESDDIMHPFRNTMIYTEHCVEIPAVILFGDPHEVDWDGEYEAMVGDGVQDYVTPPAGWRFSGWEEHAHKDALHLVSFYLERNDGADCPVCLANPVY